MKLKELGRITVGILLVYFGLYSIQNIQEQPQGYYWGRLIHEILDNYYANALEGVMLVSIGAYFIFKSLKRSRGKST